MEMRKPLRPKVKRNSPAPTPPPPPGEEYLRFTCPCGASLKIPEWRLDGHGVCPRCKRRLLLTGKAGRDGASVVKPLVLEGDRNGQTFMIEDQYRIEDHFKEIPQAQEKIAFHCPCGFKLHARPSMVDKRGKCPECGARLLLVGKRNARTQMLEIHPLVVEEASSGDTQLVEPSS
jgi:hypothetical protein